MSEFRKRLRVTTPVGEKSRTKQSDKQEADINFLIRRYSATGQLGNTNDLEAVYGDFSGLSDYHTALNRVRTAQESFESLPAEIRDLCSNDPAELVAIAHDEERGDEFTRLAEILGLETGPETGPEKEETPPPKPEPEPAAEPVPENA